MRKSVIQPFNCVMTAAMLCALSLFAGCGDNEPVHVAVCGDGVCEGEETPTACPADCTCGNDVFDDCDPTDPSACCDDPNCNLDGYCESSAFVSPLCMFACTTTAECYYNTLCFTQFGMCYPALCGTHTNSLLGGQVNEPCQVPQGNSGWCLPMFLAKHDLGVCVESGTQQHGDPCTEPWSIEMTKLCRSDPTVQVCDMGLCNPTNSTCRSVCDPDEVYENNANSTYCPAGYNCWNYSRIDDQDPDAAGCRTADMGLCLPTEATDPTDGMTACDLTNGELIENRNQTCTNIDAAYECVIFVYQASEVSWGSRIGVCADTVQSPFLNIWDVCTLNDACPPNTLCIEEDAFTTNPSGQSRCVPFCDTQNPATCNQQHSEVPASNVCTTVSDLFTGSPCTETDPSKLGLCACSPTGCT